MRTIVLPVWSTSRIVDFVRSKLLTMLSPFSMMLSTLSRAVGNLFSLVNSVEAGGEERSCTNVDGDSATLYSLSSLLLPSPAARGEGGGDSDGDPAR